MDLFKCAIAVSYLFSSTLAWGYGIENQKLKSFSRPINQLAEQPYLNILPQLRLDLNEGTISGLNEAYNKLKSSGIQDPTVHQVFQKYSHHHSDVHKTADLISLCLLVIPAAIAGGMVGHFI